MSKIMVIAGGTWQCPIIKLAKKRGHYVICSNLYENSPAFEFVDEAFVANVLDKDKNLDIAKNERPDAILTDQTDIAVPTVAYLAEKLGLKGIGSDIAERFTNKYLMREFTSKAGFASPKYRLCHTIEEAEDFLQDVSICIIKPLDSQSSRGCHIIRTLEDLKCNFEDCIQYSNAEKAILIEEYIDGTEFTIDGIKTSKEYVVTAISEKSHFLHNPNVASRLVFTQTNDIYDYDKLRKVNMEMVKALGLPFGLTHAEYKYRDGEFYLIEIAARGGGTRISSDVVPLVSGINSNELLLNMLLDGPEEVERKSHHECVILGFFDFIPGKVAKIEGIEEALNQPGVHDVEIEVKVGEQLNLAKDDRSRCGYYIIFADTKEELLEREQLLKDTVKVITE